MLTVETVQRQRLEVLAELERLEPQRQALIAMIHGYETWLRTYAPPIGQPPC